MNSVFLLFVLLFLLSIYPPDRDMCLYCGPEYLLQKDVWTAVSQKRVKLPKAVLTLFAKGKRGSIINIEDPLPPLPPLPPSAPCPCRWWNNAGPTMCPRTKMARFWEEGRIVYLGEIFEDA